MIPGESTRSLWLQWVGAGAVGAALATFFARRVSMALGNAAGNAGGAVIAEFVTGAFALGGIMLGVAVVQWLVVGRRLDGGGWVALATVAGGALGGAVTLGTWSGVSEFAGQSAGVATGMIAGLLAIGGTPWLILRGRVARAGLWGVASIAGLIASWLIVALIATAFEVIAGMPEPLMGAMFGAAYCAVTGWALKRSYGGTTSELGTA